MRMEHHCKIALVTPCFHKQFYCQKFKYTNQNTKTTNNRHNCLVWLNKSNKVKWNQYQQYQNVRKALKTGCILSCLTLALIMW